MAFFAVRATTAKLTADNGQFTAWEVILLAIILAMAAGVTLGGPTLRLRGDYLAIVTLGFGEIVHIIAQNSGSLGMQGIAGIPTREAAGSTSDQATAVLLLGAAAIVVAILLVAPQAIAGRTGWTPSARTRTPPSRWAYRRSS
ncbi:MAG: hypothetical protein WKF43_02265 [Acidimicrobiales bacterium]